MSRELVTLSLAERNQMFLDAEPKIDQAIQIRAPMRVSVWRSKIGRSTFMLQEGLEKKAYRFFPGLSQQRGLHLWHPIQISKKASATENGFDATKYNPHTVTYGFDSITYGGRGIEYATPNISIRDLRFMWQIKQQLAAVFGFLGDFTNDMWENYAREAYLQKADEASNIFVLQEGGADSTIASYDPESVDTDGDNTMTFSKNTAQDISVLDWDYLKYWSRYLQMQAPGAAIGNRDGRPSFGLVLDLEDFDKMIEKDPELREDWRYHNAQMLIGNYGSVTEYKGFSLMHDVRTPRWSIKSVSRSGSTDTITLKRIDPYTDSAAALLGRRTDVNPDYLTAEFGTAVIFLQDVFSIEIPPVGPAAPGGGVNFGATPGLNGEWKWLNIQSAKDNPLNEIGFWFMRAEAFAKPGTYREEPIVLIYKRDVNIKPTLAGTGGTDGAAERGLAENAVAADADNTNLTLSVTLEGYLTGEVGDSLTVTDDDGGTAPGIIADSSAAPTYLLALTSAASLTGATIDYTKFTAAGSSKVTMA